MYLICIQFEFYSGKKQHNILYIAITLHQPTHYAQKGYQRLTIINTEMAPDIAAKHNYCHRKQGTISRKQFQKAEEKVSEPLLVYTKKLECVELQHE